MGFIMLLTLGSLIAGTAVCHGQTVPFSAATNSKPATNPVSLAVGHFNGDGKPDLAVANFSGNNVSILLGSGRGAFRAVTNFGVETNPIAVAVADFNGDGKPDLAVANFCCATMSILFGNGSGGFAPATNFVTGELPSFGSLGASQR